MADNYIDVTLSEIFGTGVASVEQTQTSEEPGGLNVWTITLTNGYTSTFTVRNGTAGGAPMPVVNSADMTDTNGIYLYLGNEEGYTTGHWYCYANGLWTDFGAYSEKGEPGFAPTVETSKTGGTTTVTITDAVGEHVITIEDGISPTVNVANTAADMTDTSLIYVYAGSETGYTAGNWYFYNTTTNQWTSGGQYQSTVPVVDQTLTLSGAAADSAKVGQEISDLKSQIAQSGGVSSTARNLFKTILENALYKTDQSANIDALIVALTPDIPVPIYTITYSLTNVTSSKNDPTITGGESFTCTLTADEDCVLDSVTVMMGGTDITSTSYANGTVSIPLVTGNIVITATATALTVVKWDYSLGRLPSTDDGITTSFGGSNYSLAFDADKGIVATGGTTDSEVIRFTPTSYETCTKGHFEAVLSVVSISGTGNLASRLSNGTSGWNVVFALYSGNTKEICYKTNTATNKRIGTNGTKFETNTEYKFRIDYDENGNNKVYLDDDLIYDGSAVSTYYTTVNRLMIAGAITVNIKSMKWVIEEA